MTDEPNDLKTKPWAERAATELRASGEKLRRHDGAARESVLTPRNGRSPRW